jgi:hypothetical protein
MLTKEQVRELARLVASEEGAADWLRRTEHDLAHTQHVAKVAKERHETAVEELNRALGET